MRCEGKGLGQGMRCEGKGLGQGMRCEGKGLGQGMRNDIEFIHTHILVDPPTPTSSTNIGIRQHSHTPVNSPTYLGHPPVFDFRTRPSHHHPSNHPHLCLDEGKDKGKGKGKGGGESSG